ncbi:hypothetical protein BDV28DRAFT_137786 [Aspergillus coremiiformis]|uniref:Carrier domain-containing protein n=1 Tax=Aspergillus coremiiformis TaxID=138285 RepID=A0A5N6Z0B5_9EURO|nr:hypothetical protein BDV28DRAFT_137786 [Aspergillus coremiiformis]
MNGTQVVARHLTAHLCTVLTPYMVPSLLILLLYLPLTPSGKTDQRFLQQEASKLSAEVLASYSTSSAEREPSTEAQRALRQIFADALAVQANTIGIDQSFLDIGGDSLFAMRVFASCRKHDLGIAMTDLLEHKSIAMLSAQLDTQKSLTWQDMTSSGTEGKSNRCYARSCAGDTMRDI